MIDPIVFLAPQIAKHCGQGTCRVGPAYCCKAIRFRR
jgi:predicted metalloprotease